MEPKYYVRVTLHDTNTDQQIGRSGVCGVDIPHYSSLGEAARNAAYMMELSTRPMGVTPLHPEDLLRDIQSKRQTDKDQNDLEIAEAYTRRVQGSIDAEVEKYGPYYGA
jgi:hypothetical protein